MTWLMLLGGLVLLVGGGDLLVRGAVSVARRMGVSPLLIGLTLVGFGTSTPELVTSVDAALKGSPGIAIGNVVGSNICNILLILGISAMIRSIAVEPRAFYRDGGAVVAASVLIAALFFLGTLERWMGVVLVALLIGYIVFTYFKEKADPTDPSGEVHAHEAEEAHEGPSSPTLAVGLALGGLALVVVGADLFVAAAVDIARTFGVSETVIGLTVVAVGTSLPELVTSAVAAFKGRSDVAIGNVLGSNLYNILGILGVTAIITPVAVPEEILRLDVWVMIATTLILVVMAWSGHRVSRREGGVLLALYIAYLAVLAGTV